MSLEEAPRIIISPMALNSIVRVNVGNNEQAKMGDLLNSKLLINCERGKVDENFSEDKKQQVQPEKVAVSSASGLS